MQRKPKRATLARKPAVRKPGRRTAETASRAIDFASRAIDFATRTDYKAGQLRKRRVKK